MVHISFIYSFLAVAVFMMEEGKVWGENLRGEENRECFFREWQLLMEDGVSGWFLLF
jgi:hypothetical protein